MRNDKPVRVLVADDELLAQQRLEDLLSTIPNVECIACVDNGNKAVTAIRTLQPDLVLLDIQMPGLSGLQVVKEIGPTAMPATIFVTAYDKYAIEAFDAAALDYLLKPFTNKRFEGAMARALMLAQLKQSGTLSTRLEKALHAIDVTTTRVEFNRIQEKYPERISVESRSQLRVIHIDEIDYITASGVYAELHVGDKTHLVRQSMQALEERLDPQKFFRIHRSAIVQLDRVDVLLRQAGSDYTLKLKNGIQLMVGRTRVKLLESWMMGATHPPPE